AGALFGAGHHERSTGDRVLPHRRALEPHVVRVEASARVQRREELRRIVDRVGESGRSTGREAVDAHRMHETHETTKTRKRESCFREFRGFVSFVSFVGWWSLEMR